MGRSQRSLSSPTVYKQGLYRVFVAGSVGGPNPGLMSGPSYLPDHVASLLQGFQRALSTTVTPARRHAPLRAHIEARAGLDPKRISVEELSLWPGSYASGSLEQGDTCSGCSIYPCAGRDWCPSSPSWLQDAPFTSSDASLGSGHGPGVHERTARYLHHRDASARGVQLHGSLRSVTTQ